MLVHFAGPGGAVEAEHIGAHRLERGESGPDLGAQQHAAVGLHGDLQLDRDVAPGRGHSPPAPDERGLGLQEVVDGLDEEEVDAAIEQPAGLLLVRVAQRGEADLAERGELGARPHRARHPPARIARRHLPGDARRLDVELVGPIGDLVLGQHGGETAERVGLDHVDADVEERAVEVGHHVGPGVDQDLVATLERRAPEVVGAEVACLQRRAGGAVVDHDAFTHGVEEAAGSHREKA